MIDGQKLLTISVAAYNVENYIRELLSRITQSRYLNEIEVLVIDDGGNDNTVNIASEYVSHFPNSIKIIHKENGGWGSTVNSGITNATGKYFKLLDGDDYFESEALDTYIEKLRNIDADLVCTGYRVFNDNDDSTLEVIENPKEFVSEKVYNVNEVFGIYEPMMHSITVRTQALRNGNVSIMEHCFYTDAEYVIRVIKSVNTVTFVNVILYQYRVSRAGQSVSAVGLRKHYKDHLRLCDAMLELDKQVQNSQARVEHVQDGQLQSEQISDVQVSEELKKVIHKRVLNLIEAQYVIFMIMGFERETKLSYIKFNNDLRDNHTDYYKECSISIKGLRVAARMGLWNTYSFLIRKLTKRTAL